MSKSLGQQVVDALEEAAGACLGGFSALNCVDLAWALAKLHATGCSTLLNELAMQAALVVMREARRLSPGHLAMLAWAYMTLRHVPPVNLLDTLEMVVRASVLYDQVSFL